MMLDRMMLTQKQLRSGTVASSGNPATGSAQSAFEVAGDVITPPHDTIDWTHQRRSCRKTFAVSRSQDYSLGD